MKCQLLLNRVLKILNVLAAIALAIITFLTFRVMERGNEVVNRGNEITNTANMLYIHNAIQIREDVVVSSTREFDVDKLLHKNQGEEGFIKNTSLGTRKTEAVYA